MAKRFVLIYDYFRPSAFEGINTHLRNADVVLADKACIRKVPDVYVVAHLPHTEGENAEGEIRRSRGAYPSARIIAYQSPNGPYETRREKFIAAGADEFLESSIDPVNDAALIAVIRKHLV